MWQWDATCDYQVTAGAASDTAGPMTSFCPQQQLGGHTASHFSSPQPALFLTHCEHTGAQAHTKGRTDASHGVSQRQQCLQELMQTHHVSVLPFQKPRQRDPVPDLARLHPRHPHWGGTLPAAAQGPQPPDDWGVPGQQQEAIQQGCSGVSVEISSPPPSTLKESPALPLASTPCPFVPILQELHHCQCLSGIPRHISQLCVSPFISSLLSFQSFLSRPVVT